MTTRKLLIDIGANLTDSMFSGIYNGSRKHPPDLDSVLKRAINYHVKKIIITGTSLSDSRAALEIAQTSDHLFCTVGCHPTRCNEFEAGGDTNTYFYELLKIGRENEKKVVAVGEIGLDFDRLEFCSKETQIQYFDKQLELSHILSRPVFLHCRNAAADLVSILKSNESHLKHGGVVHSFDGSLLDATAILDLGYYIGINGCSLKTEENLKVMAEIPSDRLMIETDSPWCEVRPSHAGYKYIKTKFPTVKKEKWDEDKMIKGRCEPCNLHHILEIMAAVREEDLDTLRETICANTEKLFFSASE